MIGPHLGEAQEFVRAPGTPKTSLELVERHGTIMSNHLKLFGIRLSLDFGTKFITSASTDLCNSPRADPNSMLK